MSQRIKSGTAAEEARPDWMDWFEAWIAGYVAANEGVSHMTMVERAREDFEKCGTERARAMRGES